MKKPNTQQINSMCEHFMSYVMNDAEYYTIKFGIKENDLLSIAYDCIAYVVKNCDYTKDDEVLMCYIYQRIALTVFEEKQRIKLSNLLFCQIARLNNIQSDLIQDLQREPTIEELSKKTGIPRERIIDLYQYSIEPIDLDTPIELDVDNDFGNSAEYTEEIYLKDIVEDLKNKTPEQFVVYQSLKNEINQALLSLSDREAQLLKLKFGLEDSQPRTDEEVASHLFITPERVRGITAKALRKLRRNDRGDLRGYLR